MTGPLEPPAATIPADPWLDRFRVTLVAILGVVVAGIACLAFYTSFEAISAFAMRSDGISPRHAWAIPLLVDSFIVVATAADLWFVITRRDRGRWELLWPKFLLAAAAGVSFVLNVAHAEPTLAARGVAAIPPAALVLGVELLMMVLRRATGLRAARVQAAYDAAQAHVQALVGPPPPAAGALLRQAPAEVDAPAFRLEAPPPAELAAAPAAPAEAGDEPGEPAAIAARPAIEPGLPRRHADQGVLRRGAYRILFEAAPGEIRTAAELKAALGGRGMAVDEATAGRLLREFHGPLTAAAGGDIKAASELLGALTNHGVTVNLRTARRLLREFDGPREGRPGEARTPEELQAALAAHGITVDLGAAAHLLRRFDPPHPDRQARPRSTGAQIAGRPGTRP